MQVHDTTTRMGKVMRAMVMSNGLATHQHKNGQGDESNGDESNGSYHEVSKSTRQQQEWAM